MTTSTSVNAIATCLRRVGYRPDWLRPDVRVGDNTVAPCVAFSGQPFDARTACISMALGNGHNAGTVAALRGIAAPLTIVAASGRYEVWRHNEGTAATRLDDIEARRFPAYIETNKHLLRPDALYRTKIWGRLEAKQMSFVDTGLLAALEHEMGGRISELTSRCVDIVRDALNLKQPTVREGQWILKSVFWIIAAKILQDKHVERFIKLDLADLRTVFDRLARHYQAFVQHELTPRQHTALSGAVAEIKREPNLGLLSTEALAYLYENALVDKKTRQALGTHSTPTWAVDYIVGRLREWIEEIAPEERRIFEPACGHAGFLIAGLRLLSELRPSDSPEERRQYLRQRLRGIEIDPFAVEIARLSLAIADVPNPNRWALDNENMFRGDVLATRTAQATIVLSNPPFEKYGARQAGGMLTKASETLRRVAENLPPGGIFGFVVPRSLLVSDRDRPLRDLLLARFEIAEITTLPDRVFRHGAPESAIILGRHNAPARRRVVRYQRVRERQINEFKSTFAPSSIESPTQEYLQEHGLAYPELTPVWSRLSGYARLGDIASIGKGFEFVGGAALPASARSASRREGLVPAFLDWKTSQQLHEIPACTWVSIEDRYIRRPGAGAVVGVPQVLANYGRVSRGPWCLNALIDQEGHAFTSRFVSIRMRDERFSERVAWALLNSPVANAYMHAHCSKRDMLTMSFKRIPIPALTTASVAMIDASVAAYFAAARAWRPAAAQADLFTSSQPPPPSEEELKVLLWRVEAAVLGAYALDLDDEHALLSLFSGEPRLGVRHEQIGYFPKGFAAVRRLADLIAITADWEIHCSRRDALIEKKLARNATPTEIAELNRLRDLTGARQDLLAPLPIDRLERVTADLQRRGLWRGEP